MFGMTDPELFERIRRGEPVAQGVPVERLGIGCVDSNGCGLGIVVPRRTLAERAISQQETLTWGRVAAHVAAATRLRRAKRKGLGAVEAVLDPGGKVLHAEGEAVPARDVLRAAALEQDRVRARRKNAFDALNATAQWRALVSGRWSLVDEFERDGRRYLVARANPPQTGHLGDLTERERLVARAVALGHSNKQIAYELGLATSTVADHLRRAMVKLGVQTRMDLIQRVIADSETNTTD
jgi:DNA-binding CsgD family transcriptional regulator